MKLSDRLGAHSWRVALPALPGPGGPADSFVLKTGLGRSEFTLPTLPAHAAAPTFHSSQTEVDSRERNGRPPGGPRGGQSAASAPPPAASSCVQPHSSQVMRATIGEQERGEVSQAGRQGPLLLPAVGLCHKKQLSAGTNQHVLRLARQGCMVTVKGSQVSSSAPGAERLERPTAAAPSPI